MNDKKLRVGILGATGMVGQRFITLLNNHPWFEVKVVAASQSSKGKIYEDAVKDRWKMPGPIPENVKGLVVYDINDIDLISNEVDFVFSAVNMTKSEIKAIEDAYAMSEIPVVSNNSAHRWTEDVPMVIPEINDSHFDVIESQKKRLGTTKGFVAVKPNCSIQSYVPCLAAWQEFKPKEVLVTTYQAISGAGKTFSEWPEMKENVIPYIKGEEEKSENEPLKIFGYIRDGKIINNEDLIVTSQCLRVPVLDGHTCAAFVNFEKKVTVDELIAKLDEYKGYPQKEGLPTAPRRFIKYVHDNNRPQVNIDVDFEKGMGITIGRLREDKIFDYKFVGLSHNTVRGAAGGALLCAEALYKKGYIY